MKLVSKSRLLFASLICGAGTAATAQAPKLPVVVIETTLG